MSLKDNELIEILENLHREYYDLKSSKAYCYGLKLLNFIQSVKSGSLFSYIKRERTFRKVAKFNHSFEKSTFDYGMYPNPRPRIAVYSCVTGGYDAVEIPKITVDNIDFILFTDNVNVDLPVWEVRPLPQEAASQKNNTLKSRYCKMHPKIVGDGYDYALFIDGNVCVYSDVTNMINMINHKTGLAIHRHSVRNCIYEEVQACRLAKRGVLADMTEQVKIYKAEGFPKNFGLLETTVVLSDLNNVNALDILDGCWKELESKSTRDQLSLPYVIWKKGFLINDIGNLGYNLMRNPKFRKVSHMKCVGGKYE